MTWVRSEVGGYDEHYGANIESICIYTPRRTPSLNKSNPNRISSPNNLDATHNWTTRRSGTCTATLVGIQEVSIPVLYGSCKI